MIGLVIITHGQLATAFVESLEHVVGPVPNVRSICIYPKDDSEQQRDNILKAIEEVDQGQGVILLTDLFGGVPSNLAISALGVKPIDVIAGVNLPMLVRLARLKKGTPLKEAVEQAQEAGRKYIHVANALLDANVQKSVTTKQLAKK